MMAPGKRILFLKGRIAKRLGSSTDSAMFLCNLLNSKFLVPRGKKEKKGIESNGIKERYWIECGVRFGSVVSEGTFRWSFYCLNPVAVASQLGPFNLTIILALLCVYTIDWNWSVLRTDNSAIIPIYICIWLYIPMAIMKLHGGYNEIAWRVRLFWMDWSYGFGFLPVWSCSFCTLTHSLHLTNLCSAIAVFPRRLRIIGKWYSQFNF